MARRGSGKNSPATAATAEVPNENKENTVSTAAPEAVETVNESTEGTEKAEVEVDLTEFSAAIEASISDEDKRDATTGELVPELIEPVNAAFRKLEGAKAKNAARKHLNGLMKSAMNDLNMPLARSYMILSDSLSAGPSVKGEKAPADPTEAFVQRVTGLQLAVAIATEQVPDGVAEDWKDKANGLFTESLEAAHTYLAWASEDEDSRGDEPDVSSVVKAAVKLAQGKAAKIGGGSRGAGTPHEGPRRDIAKHITEAFENVESGKFLTIAEIRKFASSEYGDNPPSAGAISARLFPPSGGECTVEGIRPDHNENNKKGAVKL